MRIEYDKIIELANVRKDALCTLDELLQHAPEMYTKLNDVYEWIDKIHNTFSSIDREGVTLIPEPQRTALNYISFTAQSLAAVVGYGHGDGTGGGVKWLICKGE